MTIEVTQEDREAADIILKRAGVFSTSIYTELTQAFARHRQAAYEEGYKDGRANDPIR